MILLFTSFFQNTLSKSLALTSIFNQIQTAQAANANDPNIYSFFGKIVRLLITFEPALVTGRLLSPASQAENEVPTFISPQNVTLQTEYEETEGAKKWTMEDVVTVTERRTSYKL